jgi:hypothetical protein
VNCPECGFSHDPEECQDVDLEELYRIWSTQVRKRNPYDPPFPDITALVLERWLDGKSGKYGGAYDGSEFDMFFQWMGFTRDRPCNNSD